MALGKLSALQQRILVTLSGIRPVWTLTGGAALAGDGDAATSDDHWHYSGMTPIELKPSR